VFRSIYLLSGDSDDNWALPRRLRRRLPGLFDNWIEAPYAPEVEQRIGQLDSLIPRGDEASIVLFGRSSGARAVSALAAQRPVGAVICLSYPFRMPNRQLEPKRFAHLADLSVPTLIIQGCDDEYGGLDVTEHYALSTAVSMRFIDGDHALQCSPAGLDVVAPLIRTFCDSVATGAPFEPARFDEAFYLRTHSRASREVATGRFRSAEQHHQAVGRQEHLSFRLLPEPG